MKLEHSREERLLTASKKMSKKEMMKIWQERFESVDKIMHTLSLYGFTGRTHFTFQRFYL